MAGVNKVILIGNLGRDPEVKYLEGDNVVANVSLATTESYKDKNGQKVDITEWHDLEMWGGLAKIAEQYLSKGKSVYVEGRIKTDTWQDENGANRKRVKIRVNNLTMLGSPKDGESSNMSSDNSNAQPTQRSTSQVNEPQSPPISMENESDDLPF